MEYRYLGASGFKVPVLGYGTVTFGATAERGFQAWGHIDEAGARRIVDICLEAGVTLFDSADIYSQGASESLLGAAIKGRRDKVIISTKATSRFDHTDPNNVGSSRFHLIKSVDAALKRLQTDYIDLFQLHGFDAQTPVQETLSTLDSLVRAGKIRYLGVSNFSGWHLQKSLDSADRYGYPRYVANQAYYSLVGREYEWELMPLGLDQKVGAIVWSPLGAGRLTGKIRQGQPLPVVSRLHETAHKEPIVEEGLLYRVLGALEEIAEQTGKTVPQIALNWLLQRPTVSSILIGARNEKQLLQNLGAIGWQLTPEQIAILDTASHVRRVYPYSHQASYFTERNPLPI